MPSIRRGAGPHDRSGDALERAQQQVALGLRGSTPTGRRSPRWRILAAEAIAAENPQLATRAGRHLADRSRCSSSNMTGKGVLDRGRRGRRARLPARLEPLADRRVAGEAGGDPGRHRPAGLGLRGRRLDLRRRGGAGVRPAAHGRAAARPGAARSTGTASTTCRAPGRPRPATARPRARPTTATSTWACCARTARPSWRCRTSAELTPELGICQWFHFEDHRLDDAVRWLRELGVRTCAPA